MDVDEGTELAQAYLELKRQYDALVRHSLAGVLRTTLDGRMIECNDALAQMLGYDGRASLLHHSAKELYLDPADREAFLKSLKTEKRLVNHEMRLKHRTGRTVHVLANVFLDDGTGSTTTIQGTLIEISRYKEAEEEQAARQESVRLQVAQEVNQVLHEEIEGHRRTQDELRRSRQFARNLIDSSLDMIMAADAEGRITEYNPAACLKFGYEPEEVLGNNTVQLYADGEEYKRIQHELETHGAYAGEVHNVDKWGTTFTCYLAASLLYDEEGGLIGAMGVSRDITRMMADQEALRLSEARYRDLFDNATDLIQSVDAEGRFEYVNNAWFSAMGYSAKELDALRMEKLVHPQHRQAYAATLERVAKGEHLGVLRTAFCSKDGRTVYLEGSTTLYRAEGKPTAFRSIYRDVTGVVTARQQVQEHEAKLKALFESSEHMFWTVDPRVRLTSFNKGYSDMIERLHGARPELSDGVAVEKKKFASDDYHSFWDKKYSAAFGGKPLRFETDLKDKRGERVSNEIFLSPIFDDSGRVVEVFGVGHEITEQKVAEETVREQSARIQAIFESSANMMIWTLDKEMRITSCNEHFLRSILDVHGINFKIGDHFAERMATRVAPDRAKALLLNYSNALRGRPQQFEVELRDLSGRATWVENFLNPIIMNGEVREISCLAYGITDRKRAQRELVQGLAEKEVLLKEVHHRVKNNLQVINSIMKLQSARVENDPRLMEILHHSQDRVRSMALIHESLYQTKEFSYIDLGNYVDGLSRNLVMSYSVNARVRLDLDLGEEQVLLVLDQASPCGLVLNELISNALKHAFPGDRGGTVRVSMQLHGDRVRIGVADDGSGMPPGFDEERHGNLGLELVRMLVGQLDGAIERIDRGGVAYFLTFDRTKHS